MEFQAIFGNAFYWPLVAGTSTEQLQLPLKLLLQCYGIMIVLAWPSEDLPFGYHILALYEHTQMGAEGSAEAIRTCSLCARLIGLLWADGCRFGPVSPIGQGPCTGTCPVPELVCGLWLARQLSYSSHACHAHLCLVRSVSFHRFSRFRTTSP